MQQQQDQGSDPRVEALHLEEDRWAHPSCPWPTPEWRASPPPPCQRRGGAAAAAAPAPPPASPRPLALSPARSGEPAPAAAPWQWEESPDALRAYAAFLAILAVGTLPQLASYKLADLPYFIGLAATTIYIGAHRGLNAKQRQQISFKEVGGWVGGCGCWRCVWSGVGVWGWGWGGGGAWQPAAAPGPRGGALPLPAWPTRRRSVPRHRRRSLAWVFNPRAASCCRARWRLSLRPLPSLASTWCGAAGCWLLAAGSEAAGQRVRAPVGHYSPNLLAALLCFLRKKV